MTNENQEDGLVHEKPYIDLYIQDIVTASSILSEYKGLERQIAYDRLLIRLIEKWKRIFGFDSRTFKLHLDRCQSVSTVDEVTSYTFRELLEKAAVIGDWLAPSYLQPGAMYFWFGLGKEGKTTAAVDLIHGVLISGKWLDVPVKKGRVLWYNLEEGIPSINNKLQSRGFDDDTDSNSNLLKYSDLFRIERGFNIRDDLENLRQTIREFRPSLVVIDSFRKSLEGTGITENDPTAGILAYALQSVFIQSNTTGIIIHHANKSGKGTTKMSGHNSLIGANDGLFHFYAVTNQNGQKRIRIDTSPRDGVPRCLITKKTVSEGGRWFIEVESEVGIDVNLIDIKKKILRLLSSQAVVYTKDQIASKLGLNNEDERLSEALIELQELQIVSTTKNKNKKVFEYFLPSDSAWFSVDTNLSSFITQEARLADELSRCSSSLEIRSLTKSWDNKLKISVYKLLSLEEIDRLTRLMDISPYSIDESILYNNQLSVITDIKKEGRDFYYKVSDNDGWIHQDYIQKNTIEENTTDETSTQEEYIEEEEEEEIPF